MKKAKRNAKKTIKTSTIILSFCLYLMFLLAACMSKPDDLSVETSTEEVVYGPYYTVNAAEATRFNTLLMGHYDTYDDVFRECFGGAYLDTDGYLHILLTGEEEACKEILKPIIDLDKVFFEAADFSYRELEAVMKEYNGKVAELLQKKSEKTCSRKEKILSKAWPSFELDDKENRIIVRLYTKDNKRSLDENIELFKELWGDHPALVFEEYTGLPYSMAV